jgi:uncharacterized protein YndB with AHSA1/START domain
MRGPDGKEYANRIVYREIVTNERIVYDHDSDIDDDPNGFWVKATFEDIGGKTRITMRSVLVSAEARARAGEKPSIDWAPTSSAKRLISLAGVRHVLDGLVRVGYGRGAYPRIAVT